MDRLRESCRGGAVTLPAVTNPRDSMNPALAEFRLTPRHHIFKLPGLPRQCDRQQQRPLRAQIRILRVERFV
jgi:hypothetical protein